MSDWRTIDTAPRDGTSVLIYSPEASEPEIMLACWLEFDGEPDADGWYDRWNDTAPQIDCWPTHWAPLPAPPRAKIAGGRVR